MDTKLPIEDEAHQLIDLLRPLYAIEQYELTLDTLKEVHLKMSFVIAELVKKAGKDHNCTRKMEYIFERTEISIWCLENLKLDSKWNAEAVFELSKQVPCNFTLLERLGVMKTLKEEQARTILAKQPAALDFYKHSLAISKFLAFLFKEYREDSDVEATHITDIERLLKEITSIKLRMRTLKEVYDLCFLAEDDLKSDETSERENGEACNETKFESQGAQAEHGSHHELSPRRGDSSQVASEGKVNADETSYLCRDAKKLKVTSF